MKDKVLEEWDEHGIEHLVSLLSITVGAKITYQGKALHGNVCYIKKKWGNCVD